jgi:trimeric autotransporter adhesin
MHALDTFNSGAAGRQFWRIDMSRTLCGLFLAAATAVTLLPLPAVGQTDVLLRLRSGSPLSDRFRIDSAGGIVAIGTFGSGTIPVSGQGYRMMWYPAKAAFRVGAVNVSPFTQWDDDNVGAYSWAGGNNSIAAGQYSFAMGDRSSIDAGAEAGVAIGRQNRVWVGANAGVALGLRNNVQDEAGVAIGMDNGSNGAAAVAIGYSSTADADYSVALGHRASTNGQSGAFVINDASSTDSTEASAQNQFTARFAGGYRLYTNALRTLGVFMNANATSWSGISDRNRKRGFLAVSGEEILARIRQVPVTTWRYDVDTDPSVLHIGPMAQDWHRAFGFTADSLLINQGDFDGVNLAGVQALDEVGRRQQAEIDGLRAANAELRSQLAEAQRARAVETAELRARQERIEALLRRLEP